MSLARVTGNGSGDAVGHRVRALREAMDLSLRDLAERSGVSAPMLSQVERGETSPTLQVATRIAAGLELRLSQLLRLDEDGAVTVVRKPERRKGPVGVGGHGYEILSPPLPGQRAELSRHTLAPGRGDRRPRRSAGARARQPRDGAGRVGHGRAALRRPPLRAGRRRLRDLRRRPATPLREPRNQDAVLLAVVSAGLRRS